MAVVELCARRFVPNTVLTSAGGLLAKLSVGDRQAGRQHMKTVLIGHPIYRAPFARERVKPASRELSANFAYFKALHGDRVAHARYFLTQMGVDMRRQTDVDMWVDAHGAALLACNFGTPVTASSPLQWAGTVGGLNVVLDLAVALGEAAIAHNPQLSWQADVDAWGTFASLRSGTDQVDLVGEMARCCRQVGALAALRARFGVTTLFALDEHG